MIDLGETPILYVQGAYSGGETVVTLRDGTVFRYRIPHPIQVTLPTPEMTARFEAILREEAEHKAKAQRPAKAVAMHRDNPKLTYVAIGKAVGASSVSVSRWIRAANGQPTRPTKPPILLSATEEQASKDQALAEFTRRGGACTRSEISARAREIAADMLKAKRKR